MKRIWKKAAALLMMLAMVLAMGTTAGAAEATTSAKGTLEVSQTANSDGDYYVTNSASVEITGAPTDGTTVSFVTYQVIYATYDKTTNELTWHLTDWAEKALTTDWNSLTKMYGNETEAIEAISSLTGSNALTTGSGTTEQNTIVNRLAAYINYQNSQGTPVDEYSTTWSTATSSIYSANLELGSYLVIPTATDWSFLNMLVSVDVSETPTNTNAGTGSEEWLLAAKDAVLKGNKISIDKTVSETGNTGSYGETADVQIGDTLYYSIKVYVPKFAANDSEHIFTVTDVANNLKIKESSVVVTPYDSSDTARTALESITNYTAGVTVASNVSTLTVNFTSQYYSTFYSGGTYPYSYVIITYEAELLSSAVTYSDGGNSNTATMTYDYDNHDSKNVESTAKVYTYSLDLTKYGESRNGLSNASFKVYYYKDGETTPTYLKFIQNSDGSYSVVDSTYSGASLEAVTTTDGGTLTLTGLDDEVEYFIVESVAPSGYSLNTNILKFKITEDSATAGTIDTVTANEYTTYDPSATNAALTSGMTWIAAKDGNNSAKLTMFVTDTKISALPATGSIGIIVFTIAGVIIMILALVLINSGKSKAKKA
ncbi:MAG: LPXTG cell wall anchor domain-containing protein [Lachnospiraceae bacterium]|nr:LPXTG cell wall anchor domain-containing protein [Lachnospiraceae bacterium]